MAEVVSPTGGGGRHLLMSTESGKFVAFPCERSEGESVATRLSQRRSLGPVDFTEAVR